MSTWVETIEHGNIREIRMSRPPVNALNDALCNALTAAIGKALNDGVRGIVLSGNERLFSAGMDVPHLLAHGENRTALANSWQAFFDAARALAQAQVPVVAALGGHAPAGGCVLALCCDYRVMAYSVDPAKPNLIGLNETRVGLVAPEGIQRLLRRVVGTNRAERLLVAGELVSAEQALQIGLVDELADAADVVPRAVTWLHALLQLPHAPMLQTRAIARADVIEALHDDHIRLERFVGSWYAPQTQAALQAMVAKLKK